VAEREVRIMTPDGTLIRRLTLDLKRNYQPLGTRQIPWPHPSCPATTIRDWA
jgi:hypothetical protein